MIWRLFDCYVVLVDFVGSPVEVVHRRHDNDWEAVVYYPGPGHPVLVFGDCSCVDVVVQFEEIPVLNDTSRKVGKVKHKTGGEQERLLMRK